MQDRERASSDRWRLRDPGSVLPAAHPNLDRDVTGDVKVKRERKDLALHQALLEPGQHQVHRSRLQAGERISRNVDNAYLVHHTLTVL